MEGKTIDFDPSMDRQGNGNFSSELTFRTVEIELEEIEKLLGNLKRKSGTGYEVWRRSQVVQKQKDIKV